VGGQHRQHLIMEQSKKTAITIANFPIQPEDRGEGSLTPIFRIKRLLTLTIWKVEPGCAGFERGVVCTSNNELARQEVSPVGGSAKVTCIEHRGPKEGGACVGKGNS